MALGSTTPFRRSLLAGLALAGVTAGGPLPAVAGGLAEGRDAAPVVVNVGSETAAHWTQPTWRHATTARPALLGNLSTAPVAINATTEHARSYSFMSEVAPGDPIRWNPCSPIHWAFNPAGAPSGGLEAVTSAVARISSATGLQFAYDGAATEVPTGAYLDAQNGATGFRPLLVGWSTPSASTLLANQPASLVGMDQTIWARPSTGATHIVSGVVALNADVTAPTSGRNSWYTFALHELGHAVGLGHTTDATQIMAPTIPAAATDYGSGDLAGLAKVGGTC